MYNTEKIQYSAQIYSVARKVFRRGNELNIAGIDIPRT